MIEHFPFIFALDAYLAWVFKVLTQCTRKKLKYGYGKIPCDKLELIAKSQEKNRNINSKWIVAGYPQKVNLCDLIARRDKVYPKYKLLDAHWIPKCDENNRNEKNLRVFDD